MKISIVKAQQEHMEAIRRICAEGWRQTVQGKYSEAYKRENINYWYNKERVSKDIAQGIYTHVALVNDSVVGTIGGVVNDQGESEIYVFYVDERHRYQGIGTKLLDVFTEKHISEGAKEQYASVEEENTLGIPFYESRGFKQLSTNARFWRKLKKDPFFSDKY